MIKILPNLHLEESEIKLSYIRSPGPGGQNVNKVATGVLLRFNVLNSTSLSDDIRLRLIKSLSNKMTQEGEIIIKATRHRTQGLNKQDALNRLQTILAKAATPPKKRKKTKPTLASKERRLANKKLRGQTKMTRNKKIM